MELRDSRAVDRESPSLSGQARFRTLLAEKGSLVADGAMGTTLFDLGLESGECPERLNIERPELIAEVHRRYFEAGSDFILTNTFGGNRRRLALHRLEKEVSRFNRAGVRIGREVAAETGRQVAVAASVGPTGDLFEPLGVLGHAEAVEVFSEQMEAMVAAGADVLWIETLSSWEEMAAATEAASAFAVPHVVTLSFDTNGRTMMGLPPSEFGEWWTGLPSERRPLAIGANCGTGLGEALTAVRAIKENAPEAPVVVKSNCGIPVWRDGRLTYPEGPQGMGDYTRKALEAGCAIIGTCCGSTPRHIRAIRAAASRA